MTTDNFADDMRDKLRSILCQSASTSAGASSRDHLKDELVLLMVQRFRGRIFNLTGGKVGIDDRLTSLQNSAFMYLRERATQIAMELDSHSSPLVPVVLRWLDRWAKDKIRKSDGVTLKRGKGKKAVPMPTDLQLQGSGASVLDDVILNETTEQIQQAISNAVSCLERIERLVVLSYLGLEGQPELTMREVANCLEIPLPIASNAYRRAREKLKKRLAAFEPT